MSALPHTAKTIDLLRWVAAHPNQPFDPPMVVSLSTAHTTDWQWQAVTAQMDELRQQAYITRLNQDSGGSTYWVITAKGESYLRSLERSESEAATNAGGRTMTIVGGWEQLKPLGEGGQSKVFLARSPSRVKQRKEIIEEVPRHNPWGPFSPQERAERVDRVAMSFWQYARPDDVSELGALKVFKIEKSGAEAEEAVGRLRNEIAVLQQNIPGMVRLLDASEQDRWIVTELMLGGTLEEHLVTYKGHAARALRAFRSVVATAALLHKRNMVHRDIKPANVFIAEGGDLVLGDLGIVYVPDQSERLTVTNEKVGPRDYMPQWGDLGERLENVHTNFDVYMLGKLLWCMTAGRLKLPREYFKRDAFSLAVMFPKDPDMYALNGILDKCVVEEPSQCLDSANELLELVDETLVMLGRGGQLLTDDVPRPCRVCGHGQYRKVVLDPNVAGKPVIHMDMAGQPIAVSMFICDYCRHAEFFGAR